METRCRASLASIEHLHSIKDRLHEFRPPLLSARSIPASPRQISKKLLPLEMAGLFRDGTRIKADCAHPAAGTTVTLMEHSDRLTGTPVSFFNCLIRIASLPATGTTQIGRPPFRLLIFRWRATAALTRSETCVGFDQYRLAGRPNRFGPKTCRACQRETRSSAFDHPSFRAEVAPGWRIIDYIWQGDIIRLHLACILWR